MTLQIWYPTINKFDTTLHYDTNEVYGGDKEIVAKEKLYLSGIVLLVLYCLHKLTGHLSNMYSC